jgi:hypothetical protein
MTILLAALALTTAVLAAALTAWALHLRWQRDEARDVLRRAGDFLRDDVAEALAEARNLRAVTRIQERTITMLLDDLDVLADEASRSLPMCPARVSGVAA